jgi:3'-phosphoadenosine 5'-phosphosulfate sulfotransferase (PAPS reductase)/FAD synthetase
MSNPFKIIEPTCISFSGGRTSAYMLYQVLQAHDGKLPDEAVVCFANTGKEDEATLRFVKRCGDEWGVNIVWLEYQDAEETKDRWRQVDFETASRNGEPFEKLVTKRKYLPNPVSRFCTGEMKVLTIERYMKSIGCPEFETMVGIRADEQRRVAKMRETKLTPLVDAGIVQSDVQGFWSSHSFNLDLKFIGGVTTLGNCDLCFLKGPGQVMAIIKDNPDRAIWWARMEEKIGATFRSDRPSYASMMKFSKEQMDMFDSDVEGLACFCGD